MNKKGLKDYFEIQRPDGKTTWEYRGDYYCIQSENNTPIKRIKISFLVYSFLNVALLILEGFLDPGSLRRLYCIIPYLVVLFFSMRALVKAFGLYRTPDKMTYRQKEIQLSGLYISFRVLLVAIALLFTAQAVYMFIDAPKTKDFIALALSAVSAIVVYKNYKISKLHPCNKLPSIMQISAIQVQNDIDNG